MATSTKSSPYQKYLLNIMALYKTRSDLKAYTEILLSIATIGIFLVFAIKPTLVTIATLITKINDQQTTADHMDAKIKNLGTAQNIFTSQKTNIDLLTTAIPHGPDIAVYVRQLEGLIHKDNLTTLTLSVNEVNLKSDTTTTATPGGQVKTTGIVVTVSGSYAQLLTFLKDVESLRRPAILSKLSFSVSELSQNTKALSLTLSPKTPFD